MTAGHVAAVILAAGASRRLGQPKQAIVLGDETLLERVVRVATEAELQPVYVVLAPQDDAATPSARLAGCHVLVNESAREGMAASIRKGVAAAATAGCAGVVILACDQPAVTASHLRQLVSQTADAVVASEYAGRRGVPAYFPAHVFPQLLQLQGDVGAREMLQQATAIGLIDGDLDIDTVDDLKQARELFG